LLSSLTVKLLKQLIISMPIYNPLMLPTPSEKYTS
jgi:hypothetical protein